MCPCGLGNGGSLNLLKSDGIGVKILDASELPQKVLPENEEPPSLREIDASSSSDPDNKKTTSEDPLLDFLERRKKLRLRFEKRYSLKAVAIGAYWRQLNALTSESEWRGLYLKAKT